MVVAVKALVLSRLEGGGALLDVILCDWNAKLCGGGFKLSSPDPFLFEDFNGVLPGAWSTESQRLWELSLFIFV